MRYRGKIIDPISLWSNYVDNLRDTEGEWSNLVFCPNPNHNNLRTPAFNVNLTKPIVHCFSCELCCGYEDAIQIIEGCTKEEARKIIFENARLPFKGEKFEFKREEKKEKPDSEENLADYSYLPTIARDYFDSRNISPASRNRWQLGYDEKVNRLTIPVFDNRQRLKFIIRRALEKDQQPRYLYPKDSNKADYLYGAINLDLNLVKEFGLIIVEGSLDAIIMHQNGFQNTVALLGSALSSKQKEELIRLNPKAIYVFPDADMAGIHLLQTVISLRTHYPVYVVQYPKGKSDPADLTEAEAKYAVENAIPYQKFIKKLRKFGLLDEYRGTLKKAMPKSKNKRNEQIFNEQNRIFTV